MIDPLKELVDRTRRIETRLTRFIEAQGFDSGSSRPVFKDGEIQIPNPACNLQECLSVIPPDWNPDEEIFITHKGTYIASLLLPER